MVFYLFPAWLFGGFDGCESGDGTCDWCGGLGWCGGVGVVEVFYSVTMGVVVEWSTDWQCSVGLDLKS